MIKKVFRDQKGFICTPKPVLVCGFTLIEMIVAVAIFLVVAFTVTGTFVVALDAYRKALQINQIADNISFAMDQMSIDIREANTISYDRTVLTLLFAGGRQRCYKLETNSIFSSDDCVSYLPLTSANITVSSLSFDQKMLVTKDPLIIVPAVTIRAVGQMNYKQGTTILNLQTTVLNRQSIS